MPHSHQGIQLLNPLFGAPTFLIRDEFIKPRAAGSIDGTPASHVGERDVTDTGDKLSIAGGLVICTAPTGIADPRLFYGGQSRAAGLAAFALSLNYASLSYFGWGNGLTTPAYNAFIVNGTTLTVQPGTISVATIASGTNYNQAIILRDVGAFYVIKGGTFADWKLVWINDGAAQATAVPGFAWRNAAGMTASAIRAAQLASIWNTVFGPATNAAIFTGANGTALSALTNALGGVWVHDVGIWDVQGNAARGSPAAGTEDIANGNMEAGDPPTSWTASTATLSSVADERTGGAGAASIDVARNGNNNADATQALSTSIGEWFLITLWKKRIDAGVICLVRYQDDAGSAAIIAASSSATWEESVATHRTKAANPVVFLRSFSTGADGESSRFDDVSLKPLTLSELFSSVDDSGLSSCHVIATIETLLAGTQAGFVMCLDDASNPQNFIIGYHDGTKAWLEKCVGGVWTTLISETVAYVAGKRAYGRKNVSSIYLFYNEAKVGSTQTVGDAGIVDNTIHGLFNTHADNRLDKFQVHPWDITGAANVELDRYTK